jgi:MYXO-CTERM domain-containing protein
VAVSAVISIANVTPVRPFLTDWQRVTTDPQAADHAQELRINSSIGAIAAAGALMFIARRRRRVVS